MPSTAPAGTELWLKAKLRSLAWKHGIQQPWWAQETGSSGPAEAIQNQGRIFFLPGISLSLLAYFCTSDLRTLSQISSGKSDFVGNGRNRREPLSTRLTSRNPWEFYCT